MMDDPMTDGGDNGMPAAEPAAPEMPATPEAPAEGGDMGGDDNAGM